MLNFLDNRTQLISQVYSTIFNSDISSIIKQTKNMSLKHFWNNEIECFYFEIVLYNQIFYIQIVKMEHRSCTSDAVN